MTPPLYTQEERDSLERGLLARLNDAFEVNRETYAHFTEKGNKLAALLGSTETCSWRGPAGGHYDATPAIEGCSNPAIWGSMCFLHLKP